MAADLFQGGRRIHEYRLNDIEYFNLQLGVGLLGVNSLYAEVPALVKVYFRGKGLGFDAVEIERDEPIMDTERYFKKGSSPLLANNGLVVMPT